MLAANTTVGMGFMVVRRVHPHQMDCFETCVDALFFPNVLTFSSKDIK